MIGIGPLEILVILIVALLVIGPEKMPELARALARLMRELRGAMDEVRQQFEEITREDLLDTKEIESFYRDTIDSVKDSMEPPADLDEASKPPPELEQASEEIIDSFKLIEHHQEKPEPKKKTDSEEPPAQNPS